MADLGSLLGAAGVGGVIGKAIVSLELSTAKYQAELKAAQGETAASTGAMGNSATGLSSVWKTAMFGVGAAVVAGVAVSIKAASDLNEQINKTKEVFEGNATTVLRWSQTTAESMGVSQRAALQAASSFGQILDAAGLAEDQTSDMSMAIVKLGSDLSSFNNVEPNVALDKLQSGLAGMARPLREFGIFISAARVENVAYRDGIAEVGAELTDAQKIQARYNIILEDSAKAQGDFQRTLSESLPNQLRVLRAELENTAAAAGKALLPAVLEIAKSLVDMAQTLLPLLDLVGKAAIAFRIWGEAVQFILTPLLKFIDLIRTGIEPTDEMVRVIGDVYEQTLLLSDGIGDAGKGLGHFRGRSFQAQRGLEGLGNATHNTEIEFANLDLTLDSVANTTKISAKAFIASSEFMEHRAHQLDDALRAIAKEDWVNPRYVAFLSEQGPEWLIQFSRLTETEQKKAQQAWKDSTAALDEAKSSQDKMIGALEKLDKSKTHHDIELEYHYVGFDPTKPGMGSPGRPAGSGPHPP